MPPKKRAAAPAEASPAQAVSAINVRRLRTFQHPVSSHLSQAGALATPDGAPQTDAGAKGMKAKRARTKQTVVKEEEAEDYKRADDVGVSIHNVIFLIPVLTWSPADFPLCWNLFMEERV